MQLYLIDCTLFKIKTNFTDMFSIYYNYINDYELRYNLLTITS